MRQFLHWREQSELVTPADLLRMVMDDSGYQEMLQKERTVESSGRLENLSELARAMEDYETLGDFLEHVSLVMDNDAADGEETRSEEHTSELQSLMRNSYAVFCLKKKKCVVCRRRMQRSSNV